MLKTITLKCSNCGGNLEITPEMENFACGYCGASQIVQRRGGTISLKLLTESISKVQIGTDKTAAELAIKRLSREISAVQENYAQINFAKYAELNRNKQLFLVLAIAGPILLGGIATSLSPVLGVILAIVCIGSAGYFGYKRNEDIKVKYEPELEELDRQYKLLNKKIAQQRTIVD